MSSTIATAIEKGLTYLARSQRPSGEFATYTSPHLDMTGAKGRAKSTYVTTFVMHSLSCLPAGPIIAPMQQRAGEFLAGEQEENGAWHYDGRGRQQILPDLDCTACAVAALLTLGRRPDLSFYSLLWQNEVAPGGPYYTWLGVDHTSDSVHARDVDVLVNANILFCTGLLNLTLLGAAAYAQQLIHNQAYLGTYGVSPHLPIYALSRAYADGRVTALAPAMPVMQDYLLAQLLPPQTEPAALHVACLAAALLNAQAPLALVEPYLAALLNRQQPDGSWPAWAAYVSYNANYDGAPALTTALALEALGKYQARLTYPDEPPSAKKRNNEPRRRKERQKNFN
jgi:hypothetical protein